MANLENAVLDLYDDLRPGQTMQKFASALPSEVRRLDLPTKDDIDNLEDSQFAISIITKTASKLNKFPLNNKINTALSNEYFDLNHGKLPAEAQKIAATYIKCACDRYGLPIKESVKTAAAKTPTMTNIYFENLNAKPAGQIVKKASSNDEKTFYALVKTAGDGTTERAYALPDAEAIKKAEGYFEKFAKQFSPEDRHQFASNVVKRAVELGVDVGSESINKYAGLSYNANVDGYLSVRKKLVDDRPEFVDALNKLASYQGKEDPKTFAKVLHEFDKRAGIDRYYDKYLADPYASTFGEDVTKQASAVYDKDGLQVTEADIEKIAKNKYATLKNYFGSTLADGLKKEGAAAFVALPDDAKEVIARIVHGEIQ